MANWFESLGLQERAAPGDERHLPRARRRGRARGRLPHPAVVRRRGVDRARGAGHEPLEERVLELHSPARAGSTPARSRVLCDRARRHSARAKWSLDDAFGFKFPFEPGTALLIAAARRHPRHRHVPARSSGARRPRPRADSARRHQLPQRGELLDAVRDGVVADADLDDGRAHALELGEAVLGAGPGRRSGRRSRAGARPRSARSGRPTPRCPARGRAWPPSPRARGRTAPSPGPPRRPGAATASCARRSRPARAPGPTTGSTRKPE